MDALRKRAVVASALPVESMRIQWHLQAAGFSEVECVSDGLSALRQVQNNLTDLVVADAVLPILDGPMLAARVSQMSLQVYPAVMLLTPSDICPKNTVADSVLKRPLSPEMFVNEARSLIPERRKAPGKKRERAAEALDAIGIPRHCGRDYLLRAIEIVWLDSRLLKALTTRLYPAIAEQFGADSRHVVRAIRHVIDEAWRGGEIEAQYKLFGDTIDAKRGSPTCGEMIAQIADILRWEGKA